MKLSEFLNESVFLLGREAVCIDHCFLFTGHVGDQQVDGRLGDVHLFASQVRAPFGGITVLCAR